MTGHPVAFDDIGNDPDCSEFLRNGYVISEAEDRASLDRIRAHTAAAVREHLGLDGADDDETVLNQVHRHVDEAGLNDLRLTVINSLRSQDWFRPSYFSVVRGLIEKIVGNELVMQRGVGLSVQLPGDQSSLLPIHTDVWDGDSPFEVVLWIPLVDCFATKSMYIFPLEIDRDHQSRVAEFRERGSEDLFKAIETDARFLEINYGSALLFSQTLMHGNRVNDEDTTRWSMNCRFKSVMSPYADKRLGEFFEPISVRPATRIGLDYEMPSGFRD